MLQHQPPPTVVSSQLWDRSQQACWVAMLPAHRPPLVCLHTVGRCPHKTAVGLAVVVAMAMAMGVAAKVAEVEKVAPSVGLVAWVALEEGRVGAVEGRGPAHAVSKSQEAGVPPRHACLDENPTCMPPR